MFIQIVKQNPQPYIKPICTRYQTKCFQETPKKETCLFCSTSYVISLDINFRRSWNGSGRWSDWVSPTLLLLIFLFTMNPKLRTKRGVQNVWQGPMKSLSPWGSEDCWQISEIYIGAIVGFSLKSDASKDYPAGYLWRSKYSLRHLTMFLARSLLEKMRSRDVKRSPDILLQFLREHVKPEFQDWLV